VSALGGWRLIWPKGGVLLINQRANNITQIIPAKFSELTIFRPATIVVVKPI
jgi:hypothetical protein